MAGECIVPRGVTLRVEPGTRVLFMPVDGDNDGIGDSRLRVEGKILAIGEEGRPIIFSSAGKGGGREPGDWDSLLLNFSKGSLFEYVIIEYSNYSIHAHFSEGGIRRSIIRRNNEGCRMGGSSFVIEECMIRENSSKGLNFRNCSNIVRNNEITQNGNGVFLFEKDKGSVISGNDIYGNRRYNLRLGDFFEGKIAIAGNWWGSADEEVARRSIYDSRVDAEIGTVIMKPSASPRRSLEGMAFFEESGETSRP